MFRQSLKEETTQLLQQINEWEWSTCKYQHVDYHTARVAKKNNNTITVRFNNDRTVVCLSYDDYIHEFYVWDFEAQHWTQLG